ncbi:MAG: LexA family protein [Anaerofustis sp.]
MLKIRELRIERSISQKDLAETFCIPPSTFNQYETGKRQPDYDLIKKLADYFDVSTDYILGRSEQSNTLQPSAPGAKWIPVLGKVQAGTPVEAVEDIIDYEEINQDMAKSGEFFALQIRGESMKPKFDEGDVVIVRKQDDIESGEIAVVLVNGEDATVKKFIKLENGVSLVSTNPEFDPMFFDEKKIKNLPVRVIGKVVELRAKF